MIVSPEGDATPADVGRVRRPRTSRTPSSSSTEARLDVELPGPCATRHLQADRFDAASLPDNCPRRARVGIRAELDASTATTPTDAGSCSCSTTGRERQPARSQAGGSRSPQTGLVIDPRRPGDHRRREPVSVGRERPDARRRGDRRRRPRLFELQPPHPRRRRHVARGAGRPVGDADVRRLQRRATLQRHGLHVRRRGGSALSEANSPACQQTSWPCRLTSAIRRRTCRRRPRRGPTGRRSRPSTGFRAAIGAFGQRRRQRRHRLHQRLDHDVTTRPRPRPASVARRSRPPRARPRH